MVFVLEIRNEDTRNFNMGNCGTIFVRFKVVNETENGQTAPTMVVPCNTARRDSESEKESVVEYSPVKVQAGEMVQVSKESIVNLVNNTQNNNINYNINTDTDIVVKNNCLIDEFESITSQPPNDEDDVSSEINNIMSQNESDPDDHGETINICDMESSLLIVNLNKEDNNIDNLTTEKSRIVVNYVAETNNNNDDNNNDADLTQAISHSGQPKVPAPNLLPRSPNVMDLNIYLNRIQQYFNELGYHRQGEPKIRVHTNMSMKHQVETARSLIKAGEPIKCLHALVMAIHFTNCSNHIERFPINFKSEFKGKEYKHVVLGVYLYGMFGALGISRDAGLQDKPAAYTRLVDLIADYHKCYTESGHFVLEIKIGGIITHDPHSLEVINWKVGSVAMTSHPTHIELAFEKIAKQLRAKMGSTCLRNIRPPQLMFPSDLTPSQTTKESNTPPTLNRPPALVKKSKTMSVTLVGSASSTTNNKVVKSRKVKPTPQ